MRRIFSLGSVRLHFWKLLLVIPVLLTAVILVAGGAYRVIKTVVPHQVDIAEINQITGLSFPKSAVVVHSRFVGFSLELFAQISIDPKDVSLFLASLPPEHQVSRSDRVDNLGNMEGPSWWMPSSKRRFISVYADPPGRSPVNMLMQLDDKQNPVLFVYYSR